MNGRLRVVNVLVAGGSGFVGRHVVSALSTAGHAVRVMTRSPSDGRDDGAEDVFGDVDDESTLVRALDGVDVAYYLVHSLERADFVERDAKGAEAFARQAAASGVGRVVYLGGLGDDGDDLSAHLRSRREVEKILADAVPTVALRAGIVIGQGSVSWEILCQLVERLPIMVTPRWVRTLTQPIAIADAVAALVAAAGDNVSPGHYDIGVPDSLSYGDMLHTVATQVGRRLLIIPVPVLSPRLSSWWLRLITDVDLQTARTLVDSMTTNAVVNHQGFSELTGRSPMPFADAVGRALVERRSRSTS